MLHRVFAAKAIRDVVHPKWRIAREPGLQVC